MLRKATVADVKHIHSILALFAARGELLSRPLSEIYDHLRDYTVYGDKESGELIGCCALTICWEDLAEIRSLAVLPELWKQGIGSALLDYALDEARHFRIKRVFTLTYRPGFFAKHGFAVIDKNELPQKIWADCLKCVKFPDCDEVAMMLEI